ncbi:hypothetical protein HYT26_04480 [Candidatus Pacearchaeota archaeon]|nr:hypothetical protein [Candidatus Pacearchaeota archaeon]
MIKKRVYRILSLILLFSGVFLMLNSQIRTIGAVIGISAVSSKVSFIAGLVFISISLILFIATQRRYTLENIIKENKERFVIIDTNFLIDNFGRDSEGIKNYVINLKNAGYNIVIPREQKETELQELKGIKGFIDFSGNSDYGRIKEEAEEAIKRTEKYRQGAEFLNKFTNLKNLAEMPRTLIKIAKDAIESLSNKGIFPQSQEEAKERIKDWVKRHYTNIETDSALLASAVYGGGEKEVFLVSSDGHLDKALQSLKEKYHNLRKRIDYIHPQNYNLAA